ncbi:MAG: ATP-binding protein [Desulfobacteraceae bacterium]|nr:MAG: ATP-binding protein [Desulfobacteraceae bacterium]
MINRNSYINKIELFLDKPVIKVITGMRRVGKSTLLLLIDQQLKFKGIAADNIVCINKESLEYDFIQTYGDLYKYVSKKLKGKTGKKYILIDEVQEIESWEKAVSSFMTEGLGDCIITGSNAHLLSSELATLLTGRYVEIPIYPLSFLEFLEFTGKATDQTDKEEPFGLYLKYGGLPGIHFLPFNDEAVYPYLNSILNTLLLKDVVKRHNIRDISHLERITAYVMDNIGNITTSKSISDYFKSQKIRITMDTVQNYLSYLSQAFMIHKIKRFDLKGKRFLEFYEKYYMGDIGLRYGFIGYKEKDISSVLENIVLLELLRRGYTVSIGTLDGAEIDFIAEKQSQRLYIQVAYLLADDKIVEREFGNLEKIRDNYPKIVLSLDKKHWGMERNGILRKNIIDFLTE